MDTDDRGYVQPFDFANSAALSLALEVLHRFLGQADEDGRLGEQFRDTMAILAVRNAISYLERAALGQLTLRDQPTLLKYLVNANIILRQQNLIDNALSLMLLELERALITKMALSFPNF